AARGGGIFFLQGGRAEDCLVKSNAASAGAGAYFQDDGQASNCTFQLNWAVTEGGGLWLEEGGEVVDCRLFLNHADTAGGHGGGALLNNGGLLSRCLIYSNEAAFGGGLWCQYAGQMWDCTIKENHARWGDPAMFSAGVGGGFYLLYGGSLYNSIVRDNIAEQDAGGGVLDSGGQVVNSTVCGNFASNDVGGLIFFGGELVNSIVVSNTAPGDPNYDEAEPASLSYSCLAPKPDGEGNIADDPHFADYAARDLRLQPPSPCINQGTNQSWMAAATDLDGQPRIYAGGRVDIGAYEYQGSVSLIDTNWLAKYGLPIDGSDDEGDEDLDRMNNWREWVCDTVPTNDGSYLHITETACTGSCRIAFACTNSRGYALCYATNLLDDAWPPVPGATNQEGAAGGEMSLADTNAAARRFYRIEVSIP
ncbi:MAG: hypothetical protein KJ726_08310, partial [Verrucomicrobia bacterium]|nr:hypothetical protein [Verrucomicrobiota bacterium]